ncbi:MAG: OadG family protein [Acidobacteria bacterium]|nr:OadG family protein [Acidobacteriota bacterium]
MWENITQNNGWAISAGGLLIVFGGLILIACVILLFNRILEFVEKRSVKPEKMETEPPVRTTELPETFTEPVPEEDQIAIAALIELYRRVHFDAIQSEITFVHGNDAQNAWRLGFKYGQRKSS